MLSGRLAKRLIAKAERPLRWRQGDQTYNTSRQTCIAFHIEPKTLEVESVMQHFAASAAEDTAARLMPLLWSSPRAFLLGTGNPERC